MIMLGRWHGTQKETCPVPGKAWLWLHVWEIDDKDHHRLQAPSPVCNTDAYSKHTQCLLWQVLGPVRKIMPCPMIRFSSGPLPFWERPSPWSTSRMWQFTRSSAQSLHICGWPPKGRLQHLPEQGCRPAAPQGHHCQTCAEPVGTDSASDHRSLRSVVQAVERIIGTSFPCLRDIFTSQNIHKAVNIATITLGTLTIDVG